MLCALQEEKVITALIKLIDAQTLPAFTDEGLPFYYWHARLYLMITLARAAKEYPDSVFGYTEMLLKWSLKEPQHVLIRHFAAEALLSIEEAHPKTMSDDQVKLLKSINDSSFSDEKPYDENIPSGWNMDRGHSSDFYFPYDFDRYWVGPLAESFNLPYEKIAKSIEAWALREGERKTRGKWDEDPRGQRGYYRSLSTMCKDGSYPDADSLSFYLSYHGIFCVAADLLSKNPLSHGKSSRVTWKTG